MSHFTVLVIGEEPEKQLQPHHEYECTGIMDENVVWVDDIHDEHFEQYNNDTIECVVRNGKIIGSKYSKDPVVEAMWKRNGIGFSTKDEFVLTDGYDLVDIPFKEKYPTFDEFMDDYCGYTDKHPETERFGRWTNPNAKWDWFLLGGRWTGFFRLKEGAVLARSGEPGLMTKPAESGRADMALKRDIDFDAMRDEKAREAKKRYEDVERIFGDSIPRLDICWKTDMWDGGKYEHLDIEEKRKIFHEQPAMKRLEEIKKNLDREHPDYKIVMWLDLDEFQCTKDEFIARAADRAISTFAVIKDGNWYEKGEMGCWGAVSNEKDQGEWNEQFHNLVDNLPDDTLLSVYDCHI